MSKYLVTALLLLVIGGVLANPKTVQQRSKDRLVLLRPSSVTEDDSQNAVINGKDAADESNQGVIATYWNSFLKRARLPLPTWNITNPLSNLFTPYVVEVDYPTENKEEHQLNGQSHLILLDPVTNQYYKVQPVSY